MAIVAACSSSRRSHLFDISMGIDKIFDQSQFVTNSRYFFLGGLNASIDCSFCGMEAETSDHLFMACTHSIGIWKEVLTSEGKRPEMSSFREWIEHVFTSESMVFRQTFTVTTWVLWFTRNKIRFEGASFLHVEIVASVKHHLGCFQVTSIPSAMQQTTAQALSSPGPVTWSPPEAGWIKINCDASVVAASNRAGLGCVVRNELGVFVAGKSSRQAFNPSVLLLEIKAIRMGLEVAKEAGCRKIVIESDCLVAVDLLSSGLPTEDRRYSNEIRGELDFCRGFTPWFEECSFMHICRDGNGMAHAFAKFALHIDRPLLFTEKPSWAIESLYGFSEPVGV